MALKNGRNFETLDGLRGIAALAVFTCHAPSAWGLMHSAYLAVDLFFVLSGFVLAHAYGKRLSSGMTWSQFALLRAIRLYPLYALGIFAGLSLAITMRFIGANEGLMGSAILKAGLMNFLFIPAVGSAEVTLFPHVLGTPGPYPFDYPLWSIFWELLGSLLFAVVAPRLSHRWLATLLGLGAILLAATAVRHGSLDVGSDFETFAAGPARLFFSFVAGVAVYRVWQSGRLSWLRVPSWVALLLLIALLAANVADGPDRRIFDTFATLIAFPVLVLASTAQPARWLAPICTSLGGASYAFYVLHLPILLWTDMLLSHLTGQTVPGLTLPWTFAIGGVTLVIAHLVDRLYDRPVRALLTRLSRPSDLWQPVRTGEA